jgi:hypothetical protein
MPQIDEQRKGRGFEKAENFLNRCAVGLLATRLAIHKTNSGVKIQERYANWYSFTVHPTVKDTLPAQKLIAFSGFLDDFKSQRHSKVHQGQNPKNRFEKIIFWDAINKAIGKPRDIHDKILDEHTKEQIHEAIAEIESIISETAKYTFEFLDSMESRLDEIISN